MDQLNRNDFVDGIPPRDVWSISLMIFIVVMDVLRAPFDKAD